MRTDLLMLAALAAWPILTVIGWRLGFRAGRQHELDHAERRAAIIDRRRREGSLP